MLAVNGSLLNDLPSRVHESGEAGVSPVSAAPPRLLVWVSVGLVIAGSVMAVVGALRTGVSWMSRST